MGKEGLLRIINENDPDSPGIIIRDSFEEALIWKASGGVDSDYTVELESTALKVGSGAKSLHLKTPTTTPAINDWVSAYVYRGTPSEPKALGCGLQFLTLAANDTFDFEIQFYLYKGKTNTTSSARMRWSGGDAEWQVYNGLTWIPLEGLPAIYTSPTVEHWHSLELIIDTENNRFVALRIDDALATNIKNIPVQSAGASGQHFVFLGFQLTTLEAAQKECWIDDVLANRREG